MARKAKNVLERLRDPKVDRYGNLKPKKGGAKKKNPAAAPKRKTPSPSARSMYQGDRTANETGGSMYQTAKKRAG
jgi:hypothetical protein